MYKGMCAPVRAGTVGVVIIGCSSLAAQFYWLQYKGCPISLAAQFHWLRNFVGCTS
jgi:hypothetical protein